MRKFNVYQFGTSNGHFEAVKDGWSWPGFFFNWIWAFAKGLNKLGALLVIAHLALVVVSLQNELLNVVAGIVGMAIPVWVGAMGNKMRGQRLEEEGYTRVGTIEASSEEAAVATFESSVQAAAAANADLVG